MAVEGPMVYVVDDESDVLRALSRLLRSDGLATRTFDDPLAFLAQVEAENAGCVLLDLSMPELDGLAVQRLLAEKGCTLPVIFLSGNADMRGEAVELLAHRQPRGKSAYERLLGDAMDGDDALFTCGECVQAAWAIVDPVLRQPAPPILYEPGSAGPP